MAAEQSERELPRRVLVGRVRKPHGVRGEVAVEVHSDVAERFAVGSRLVARTGGGETRHLSVAGSRPHGDVLLVRFEGIEDRDAADALRAAELEVARRDVPPPPEGAYYYYQLIDCRLIDRREGELGRVIEVVEDGGGLLLAIDASGGRALIPFVESYVRAVDIEAGVVETELPRGLIETCTSTS